MKRNKAAVPILIVVVMVMLLAGLTGWLDGDDVSGSSTGSSMLSQNINEIFPKDRVVDVKITIDEADFQDMLDNAAAEELKTASVEYDGKTYDNIAIRTKGNLSLNSVVRSDSDRYSFKLSFDEYISSQTYNGISKINLNNNYSDATYMREFLTYELAESMGLPTPGYSYVNVYVNDELWGFYLAVEQIGDTYLERNFGNSYGALYKAVQGTGTELAWIDDNLSSYGGLVQKSDKSNNDILIDMINELNNGTDIEKYLDVEDTLRYIALNVLTVNSDSYLGMNKHNYYLYEDDGVFSVLPWDFNMAFGGLGSSSLLIDEPTQGAVADRPLIAKLLEVDEYKELYHSILNEALEGYLAQDKLEARVQEISDMISAYVEQDPRPFYTYDQYESGIKSLISNNATTTDNYKQQLDGTIQSTNNGEGSGGGMGGGFPGNMEDFDPANMPEGFDPANMPDMGNFDPANMPEGFDPANMPDMGNFDPANMPEGFDPANMPGTSNSPTGSQSTNNNDAVNQPTANNTKANRPTNNFAAEPTAETKPIATTTAVDTESVESASYVLAEAAAAEAQSPSQALPTGQDNAQPPQAGQGMTPPDQAPPVDQNGQAIQGEINQIAPAQQQPAEPANQTEQEQAQQASPSEQGQVTNNAPAADTNNQNQAGQNGQNAQNNAQGGRGGMNGMQRPEGMGGGGMGGGGFPGGFPDGFGNQQSTEPQGSIDELILTLVSLVVLFLACLFVIFYKRRR